ncbi:pre-mRNA-processing factor 39 [Sarocladium implicatum]|nr:pre-mRNA-processing factor 39 [Sarocladium implicatum]
MLFLPPCLNTARQDSSPYNLERMRAGRDVEGLLLPSLFSGSPACLFTARRITIARFPPSSHRERRYINSPMVTRPCVFNLSLLFSPYLTPFPSMWHISDRLRRLFERGAQMVGLDFLAHPFWDKYIEFEERHEAHDRICGLLLRIISIPMHQYARYYERFRTLAHSRPLTELADPALLASFRSRVEAEAAAQGLGMRQELEIERDVRAKIDAHYYETFTKTQEEVSKRWTYESEIKRPYFHVTELDHQQLNNWRKYLDFEEEEGDHSRVVCLYERCLVTCAFYDEFWFRYARWMLAQQYQDQGRNLKEEVRNIYIRASTMFVPVSRPGIRLQWSFFEESCGRVDIAREIHEAILMKLPDCVEVIVSWAHLQRRQSGLDAALQVLKDHIDAPTVDLYTKAALVAECAFLLWRFKDAVDETRSLFLKNVQWYADSRVFWEKWFEFELQQRSSGESPSSHAERVKQVFDELCNRSRLDGAVKRELSQNYIKYLVQAGGKDAMTAYLEMAARQPAKENGASKGEIDAASKPKAEARYLSFYELHPEPQSDAQGPADFN